MDLAGRLAGIVKFLVSAGNNGHGGFLMPYVGVPKTLAAMRCMKAAFED